MRIKISELKQLSERLLSTLAIQDMNLWIYRKTSIGILIKLKFMILIVNQIRQIVLWVKLSDDWDNLKKILNNENEPIDCTCLACFNNS